MCIRDSIHVANGTLLLDGTFTEGRPAIVRSRLPVAYNPDAPAPVIWLSFLDGLLYTCLLYTSISGEGSLAGGYVCGNGACGDGCLAFQG